MFPPERGEILVPFPIQPSLRRINDVEIGLKLEGQKGSWNRRVRHLGHGIASALWPAGSAINITKTFFKLVGSLVLTPGGGKVLTARYSAKLGFKMERFFPTVATTYIFALGYFAGAVVPKAGDKTLKLHMKLRNAMWKRQFSIEKKFTIHTEPLEMYEKSLRRDLVRYEDSGSQGFSPPFNLTFSTLRNFANVIDLLSLSFDKKIEREELLKIISHMEIDYKRFHDFERAYGNELKTLTSLERFVYFAVSLKFNTSKVQDFEEIIDCGSIEEFLPQSSRCLYYIMNAKPYISNYVENKLVYGSYIYDNIIKEYLTIFWSNVEKLDKEEEAISFLLKEEPQLLLELNMLKNKWVQKSIIENASKLMSSLKAKEVIKFLKKSSVNFRREFIKSLDLTGREKLFGKKLPDSKDYISIYKDLSFDSSDKDQILTSLIPPSKCYSLIKSDGINKQLSFLKMATKKQIEAVFDEYKIPKMKSLEGIEGKIKGSHTNVFKLKNLLEKDNSELESLKAFVNKAFSKTTHKIIPLILEKIKEIYEWRVKIDQIETALP